MFFSDLFRVPKETLASEGLLDICLFADLPAFIDPFLIFHGKSIEYQALHEEIIKYLVYIEGEARGGRLNDGRASSLLYFPEVKQNWLGYTEFGNGGRGLGRQFAASVLDAFRRTEAFFREEDRSQRVEKLHLIRKGVGKDSISDLTTNLITGFLARQTEKFARKHVDPKRLETFVLEKAEFNYETGTWARGSFQLPCIWDDFIILTPLDILAVDQHALNRHELVRSVPRLAKALSNEALRGQLNHYISKRLSDARAAARTRTVSKKAKEAIWADAIDAFPLLLDAYVETQDKNAEQVQAKCAERIEQLQHFLVNMIQDATRALHAIRFAQEEPTTYEAALRRAKALKDAIENKGLHRMFYKGGCRVGDEGTAQQMFRLLWYGSYFDASPEVNAGRGPVDYQISMGAFDKSLVEFKLASNTALRRNLRNQASIYEAASDAKRTVHIIIAFSQVEIRRAKAAIEAAGLAGRDDVLLVDADRNNKPSGSTA